MESVKRKPGRPALIPGEKRNKTRGFRIRPGMEDQLVAAARLSKRSVSEEIEFRLARSFDEDRLSSIEARIANIEAAVIPRVEG